MPALTTLHLSIRGRVQGVGFREGMSNEALRLGVTGWVRNRHDGSVEAIVQGTQAQVDELLRWVHRGPPTAMVLRVEVGTAEGHFDRFERRPTA